MIGSLGSVLRAGGRQLTRVLGGGGNLKGDQEGGGATARTATRESSSDTSDSSVFTIGGSLEKATDTLDSAQVFTKGPATMTEAKMYPTLEKLDLLGHDHIRIKDLARVEQLMNTLVEGGKSKLQVIADYDMTMTRSHLHGKRAETSFGVMDNSPNMPAFYREEANQLLATYYPIEIHPTMTEAEKIPHMIEWYGRIHNLLVKCQFTQSSLKGMVAASNTRLREGAEELFWTLHKHEVPVLVLSAGMGDILEEVLRHFKVYTDNVKVVSNFFKYNEEGVMVGFKDKTIHMFNKNEDAIHSSDYFHRLEGRNNVILMGDSLGDVKMAIGVPQPSHVLKIGFLNEKIPERLDSYMDAFDIVLLDDQTMDVANRIVDLLK